PVVHHTPSSFLSFFFVNDPATTEIYTLSLHDALPIFQGHARGDHLLVFLVEAPAVLGGEPGQLGGGAADQVFRLCAVSGQRGRRSEEHTSELQSLTNLVCRLLLEKKKKERHRPC